MLPGLDVFPERLTLVVFKSLEQDVVDAVMLCHSHGLFYASSCCLVGVQNLNVFSLPGLHIQFILSMYGSFQRGSKP